MKPAFTTRFRPLSRRNLLQAGCFGVAWLAGTPGAFSASANPLGGRILGLTTTGNEAGTGGDTSELLSLDLASGEHRLAALDEYRLGHSLVALPDGGFFAVPYGEEQNPCLFLAPDFSITGEFFAPRGHGFGGHAVLLPDNQTLFTHFNISGDKRGRTARDTGQLCLIDVATRQVVQASPSAILHGHDIIVTRDRRTVIIADDGNIESPVPINHPYGVISHKPALHLYDAITLAKRDTIDLPINGGLVHIEEGADGRVYGGAEQFVYRDAAGTAILESIIGEQTDAYLAGITDEQYQEEVPLPGPLVGIDLDNHTVSSTTRIEHSDPFDMRLNLQSGLLFSVFSTSDQLARYDAGTMSWSYFSTKDFGVEEPFGLIELPGTTLMAVNGYEAGIAVFDAVTMTLVRHFDIPTYGMKHMLFSA